MGGGYLPGLLLWASQFSLLLVALALALCLTGSYAVMILLHRARVLDGSRKLAWFSALCLCFGADVWATHFITMLAFNPGVPVYYNTVRTALSILAAVLGGAPAFTLLLWRSRLPFVWVLAGVLLGRAIAVMHFTGMSAMELCGSRHYQPVFVAASILAGMGFSALALRAKLQSNRYRRGQASLLLTAGICGLHFTAMGGLEISPAPGWVLASVTGADKSSLAIAGVSLLLLAGLLVSASADAKLVERELEAQRLWHLSRHDDLTSLLNRPALREKLEILAADPGNRPMLLSIGLDRLKPLNDLFGRDHVDKLFCQAAARLAAQLQAEDLLARPGGDEFVVLRAAAPPQEEALALARRLIACLAEPFIIEGVTAQIGASAGLVCGDGGGERAEALLTAADIALREVQAAGGGLVRLFTAEMSARLLRRHQLEQEFHAALRNREFLLHYQPLFDCRSLKLRGFEALARWQHPARGLIGPDEFIPVAEAGGMITALGVYVLEEACRTARSWPEELRIAVNLSPIQLKDPSLPEKVGTALAKSGLAPQRLELELTEGAVLEQTDQVQACLAALKASGVSFAIDDFGGLFQPVLSAPFLVRASEDR